MTSALRECPISAVGLSVILSQGERPWTAAERVQRWRLRAHANAAQRSTEILRRLESIRRRAGK